ncbi:DUF3099 domain-containing protein [Nigerium massiliense]|uniref:DUF3099 domain-containing protein n=1 Tax=Nigerium massiliense TaxID=1522317 RepID=UPI0006945B08|nr:DUF3099 domain-containing protein [Nigerium massiliense]
MAGRATHPRPTLITSARKPRSLDADERQKRYLITMSFRVACFLFGCFLPLPWNWAAFIAAAILPGVAVILANAIDRRTVVEQDDAEPTRYAALPPGLIIPGDVDDKDERPKEEPQ